MITNIALSIVSFFLTASDYVMPNWYLPAQFTTAYDVMIQAIMPFNALVPIKAIFMVIYVIVAFELTMLLLRLIMKLLGIFVRQDISIT